MMNIQQYIPTACLCLLCFVGGCLAGDHYAARESIVADEKQGIQAESATKTEIAYVPKKTVNGKKEKTDLQADIGKTDFVVRVNGKEQTFTKAENERYVFDENKLTLDQTSKVTMDINIPTRDKTKRWAVGVGYGNDGMAYTVDFPIGKSDTVGGWAYKDNDSHAVGVKIKF